MWYPEAAKLLDEVNTSVLSQEGLTDYYDARSHVCGEIANYSLLPEVKAQYYAAQRQFRDSLERVADKGSDSASSSATIRTPSTATAAS